MAKKRYKVDILSQASIQQLKNDLKEYENSLTYKTQILAERLAELGVQIARVKVAELDAVFTGELISSIHSEYKASMPSGAVFAIVTDSEHAAFVEFGTGIVGLNNSYPFKFPEGVDWKYASGETIRQLADGRYGWFYEKDGDWYFTEGMPARPFMYNTYIELMSLVEKTAKEIFK